MNKTLDQAIRTERLLAKAHQAAVQRLLRAKFADDARLVARVKDASIGSARAAITDARTNCDRAFDRLQEIATSGKPEAQKAAKASDKVRAALSRLNEAYIAIST